MRKKLAPLWILLAGALWGSMGLFVRRLNACGLAAIEVTQIRMTAGLVIVGLYLLLFRRDLLRVRLRDLWCFFGTGIISLLLFSYCYFRNMTYTSLSVAAILLYTAPAFVMLLSLLLFHEKMTVNKVLALVLALAGCALVSGIGTGAGISGTGLLLGLGSGLFYALYSIFGRYAINRGYQSLTITFYTFLFCSVGCAFLTDWPVVGAAMTAEPSLWGWVAALGLLTAFFPYLLYSTGLQYVESGKASILASVEPVVGTLLGVFLFREALSLQEIAGIVLVLAAIVVLSSAPFSRKSEQSVNNSVK